MTGYFIELLSFKSSPGAETWRGWKLFALIFILVCFSCNPKKTTKTFQFDNVTVSLPCTVAAIKDKLDMEYQIYRGFRSKTDNYEIVLHIQGYHTWVNSENITEDFYANKKVIGITFIKENCSDINTFRQSIEKRLSIVLAKDKLHNYYTTKSDNAILVFSKKKNCYLSFYNGINEMEISEYFSGTW